MIRTTLVPASLAHVGPIATRMREIDRQECAAFGRSPKEGLRYSLRTSVDAMTALSPEGLPLAMMGVSAVNLLQGVGSPWFLGRDEVFDYPRDLLTLGRPIIEHWLETFGLLENVISLDNEKALRMLWRWGAEIDPDTVALHGAGEDRMAFVKFRFGR